MKRCGEMLTALLYVVRLIATKRNCSIPIPREGADAYLTISASVSDSAWEMWEAVKDIDWSLLQDFNKVLAHIDSACVRMQARDSERRTAVVPTSTFKLRQAYASRAWDRTEQAPASTPWLLRVSAILFLELPGKISDLKNEAHATVCEWIDVVTNALAGRRQQVCREHPQMEEALEFQAAFSAEPCQLNPLWCPPPERMSVAERQRLHYDRCLERKRKVIEALKEAVAPHEGEVNAALVANAAAGCTGVQDVDPFSMTPEVHQQIAAAAASRSALNSHSARIDQFFAAKFGKVSEEEPDERAMTAFIQGWLRERTRPSKPSMSETLPGARRIHDAVSSSLDRLLAMAPTSVEDERCFSFAKLCLSPLRNSMASNTLQHLVLARQNLDVVCQHNLLVKPSQFSAIVDVLPSPPPQSRDATIKRKRHSETDVQRHCPSLRSVQVL